MAAPDAQANAEADVPEQDNARDPLEGFNRAMYTFNDKFDRYLLKPVAKGYRAITPKPVSRGISNFFSNLHDPGIMLNNLLQGKPKQAGSDLGRFLVNTTLGIAGLFDVASKMGMEKHNEAIRQTLAKWGVGEGSYLVPPFLGPSNVRDGAALPVELEPTRRITWKSRARATSCWWWRWWTSARSCWKPVTSWNRRPDRTRIFSCARPIASGESTRSTTATRRRPRRPGAVRG